VFAAPGGLKAFHVCGGSLIAPDIVLSAAHCVTSKLQYAQLGKYHKHANHNRPHTVETIKIAEKVLHPQWKTETFAFDLVLIKLESKTQRKNNILKIQTQDDITDGEPVQVMGWGKTRSGGRMSTLLRHVSVNVMSNEKCMSNLYGYGNVIKDMMMCANNGPADACQGDSGGPMVRQDPNDKENPEKDVQVGIVSWGFGCSFSRYPGVYARIQFDWIQETICNPETGLSPLSCAGPNQLYAAEDTVGSAASKSDVNSGQPTCVDKTTTISSRMLPNLTCELVAQHRKTLCYYHGNDCPASCCPDDCDPTTGECMGDTWVLP
jgi:trypsin